MKNFFPLYLQQVCPWIFDEYSWSKKEATRWNGTAVKNAQQTDDTYRRLVCLEWGEYTSIR
jgi:hypothetical protein